MLFVFSALFALLISALLYHRSQPRLSRGRRGMLFGLRSIALYILLLILLSPILHFITQKQKAPQILFLKDTSRSMDITRDGFSKQDLLKEPLQLLKQKYQQAGYNILEYSFADGTQGSNANSLLGKSLAEIGIKEDFSRIQALILASDGWLRDENFGPVSRLGIPLYALADTARFVAGDLAVMNVQANRYAYRNESTIIRAGILATDYSGPARVNLYLGQNRIGNQTLNLEAGIEQYAEFTHRFPQTGFYNFRVEAEPLAQEQRLGNNAIPGAIEVLAEKELIAVFSDAPGWDNKFILDAIATNPRWQSVSYQLRNAVAYKGEEIATLPDSERPVVIVIINNGNLRLDAQSCRYIEDRLKRGSGLFYQGLPLPELTDFLPLIRSNITSPYQGFVQLNNAGKAYPMLSALDREAGKLPPLDYYYLSPAPGSEILGVMNNPQSSPALAIRQTGQSRALSLSFLNLWKWQLQSADSGYQKMLVNSLTWLSNKALGSYSAIYKSSYLQGESIIIRLRAEDDIRSHDLDQNPQISIFDTAGKLLLQDFMTRRGEEYLFETDLSESGNYSFEIREPEGNKSSRGSFAIAEMAVEERDFDFNLPLLGYLASESRGRIIPIQSVDKHQALPPTIRTEILKREFNLYKQWYIIALFILTFCLELFFRRRWGLL
jgi:hypothetical protein